MSNDDAFELAWKDDKERKSVSKMISDVQHLLNKHHHKHFLGGMSLLGYARNRSLLAWENGVEFIVDEVVKPKFNDLTQELSSLGYKTSPFWGGIKIFPADAPLVKPYTWAFPFADVVFFKYKAGGISEFRPMESQYEQDAKTENNGDATRKFPESDLFPSNKALLDGYPVEVPARFDRIAKSLFGKGYLTECKSRRWDTRLEKARKGTIIKNCHELESIYPFAKEWKVAMAAEEKRLKLSAQGKANK